MPFTAAIDTPAPRERCAAVPGPGEGDRQGLHRDAVYRTPKNLRPGTYTYFCRVHPFMRGAFRVVAKRRR